MDNKNIVLLLGDCKLSNVVYHSVKGRLNISCVFVEDRIPRKKLISRRIKRLGFIRVIGQILFQMLIVPFLNFFSQERIQQIICANRLDTSPIDKDKITYVPSINDQDVIEKLKGINPDLILVNGTRILSESLISAVNAKIFNIHVGITPRYRGVHGAYWALVNDDSENCGVTVHLIDKGIDTGGILYQGIIRYSDKDNLATYPYLQISAAIPMLLKAIQDEFDFSLTVIERNDLDSKLWSHPTIWNYLLYWLLYRVR